MYRPDLRVLPPAGVIHRFLGREGNDGRIPVNRARIPAGQMQGEFSRNGRGLETTISADRGFPEEHGRFTSSRTFPVRCGQTYTGCALAHVGIWCRSVNSSAAVWLQASNSTSDTSETSAPL